MNSLWYDQSPEMVWNLDFSVYSNDKLVSSSKRWWWWWWLKSWTKTTHCSEKRRRKKKRYKKGFFNYFFFCFDWLEKQSKQILIENRPTNEEQKLKEEKPHNLLIIIFKLIVYLTKQNQFVGLKWIRNANRPRFTFFFSFDWRLRLSIESQS